MAGALRFIRKNGKIIPIMAASAGAKQAGRTALSAARGFKNVHAAAKGAKGVVQTGQNKHQPQIKVNHALDLAGLGLSVASGVVAAATFSGGAKKFVGGAAASHGLDAVGIAANLASVSGKGNSKERLKQAARQEGRNLVVGNAVYAAGLLASKSNREAIKTYGTAVLNFARKALRVTRG